MTGLDMARAVARLQGRCPGVPLDGGGYSGCRRGADCPVCKGRAVEGMPTAIPFTPEEIAELRDTGLAPFVPGAALRLLASYDQCRAQLIRVQAEREALLLAGHSAVIGSNTSPTLRALGALLNLLKEGA